MAAERFSMNHFTPLTIDEKIFKAEEEIRRIQDEIEPIVDRKREIEAMLTEVNAHKKEWLPDDQFAQVMKTRSLMVKDKYGIEEQIRKTNKELRDKLAELDKLKLQRKKLPKDEIEERLIELRDKYMSFSSDSTRVSSMRAMSSKFVEEISGLLKCLKMS